MRALFSPGLEFGKIGKEMGIFPALPLFFSF